jgi:hypothetical protein
VNAANPKTGTDSLQARRIAAAALAAWGTALAVWIWGRTGDVAGDFGHELYIAWQMNAGRILYRDLSYPYGPLPACINAMWMRLLGPRLDAILFGNALILILATWLLYRLCRRCAGPSAAFVATIYFLTVFALSCPTKITTFNFLTPYAPGIVHGFVLCLGMIEALMQYHRTSRPRLLALAAALTGLALLCKPEMFLACFVTFWAGLMASWWLKKSGDLKSFGMALGAMIAPPLVAFLILSALAGGHAAAAAVFNGWQFASKQFVLDTPFYRQCFGTDNLPRSLFLIAITALVDLGVVGALLILAVLLRRWRSFGDGPVVGVCLFFLVPAGTNLYWVDADRGLLIWAIFAATLAALTVFFRLGKSEIRLAQFLLLIFALASLVKIFFNVRTYHYGFVLAAPCMVSLVLALVRWLPDLVDEFGGAGRVVRWGSIGLLAALAWNRMAMTDRLLAERTLTVPLAYGGMLSARPVDRGILDAMSQIAQLPPNATLDVLPDGSGINYALARTNPTRFDLADPICLHLDGGEEKVLAALERNPPDAILLIRIDKSIVGARWFGENYALGIFGWLQSNYRMSAMFGDQSQEKSAQLWLRKQANDQ